MKPKYLWMRPILALLAMLGLLGLTGFFAYQVWDLGYDKAPKELMMLLVLTAQTIVALGLTNNGFYFNTSQGSANKAETIDKMVNGEKIEPTPPEEIIMVDEHA